MGFNHATCGILAGLASLPFVSAHDPASQVAWVLAVSGAALMPDLDTTASSAARMWGPATRLLASGISVVARGHRQGTHDAFLAPLVLGALAWVATLHQVSPVAVLAILIGLAVRALTLLGMGRIGGFVNLAVSLLGAYLLASNAVALSLIPAAVVVGTLTHIVGDWPTRGGVPVPVAWLWGSERRLSAGWFDVGSPVEVYLVGPVLAIFTLLAITLRLGMQHSGAVEELLSDVLQRLTVLPPT